LDFKENNLAIFPLRTGGSPDLQKAPAIKNWQQESKVMGPKPGVNYGIDCGKSKLLVVDIDEGHKDGRLRSGLSQWKTILQDKPSPDTFICRTPRGGYQLYFRAENAPTTAGLLAPHIDTRGRGGLVVAPGATLHNPDGSEFGSYTIHKDLPIAPAPEWLLELLNQKKDPLERPADEHIGGSIPAGSRDTELTRWAGVLRHSGLSTEEIHAALSRLNEIRCDPPLEASAIERISNSIGTKPRDTAGAIADFIRSPEEIQKELAESKPKQIGNFTGPTPTRDWVIKDWLPKNELTLLYGGGSVGKSLLSLQLAIGVGTGTQWLGLDCQKMPVLYVACEDTDDELHIRRDRILGAGEYAFENNMILNAPIYLWSRVGYENDMAVEEDSDVVEGRFLPVLEQAIVDLECKETLLILDTLSDVYLGSENVREKVNKFVKTILGKLRLSHNLTIIILAHPSRTGMNTGDMASGSTAWENASRNRLTLSRDEDNPRQVNLTRVKSNYAAVGEIIPLQYDDGRFVVGGCTPADYTEQQELLTALEATLKPKEELSIPSLCERILTSPDVSHLYSGTSARTLGRKLIVALKKPAIDGILKYQLREETRGSRVFTSVVVLDKDT